MSDDRAPQAPGATLAAGQAIGPYVVTAVTRSSASESVYWAEGGATGDPVRTYEMRERAGGAYDYARPVASLGLSHAHLLAPVAVLTQSGRDFLVTQALTEDAHGTGARLSAEGALAAGAALADALTYLHGGGVAHLRVSPALIVVHGAAAYLTGLEDAQLIHPQDPNAGALFARDAAFLAHSLGALAGIPEAGAPTGQHGAALAAIVARASAGEYATPAQVGADCAAALARPAAATVLIASPAAAAGSRPAASPAAVGAAALAINAAAVTSVGMVREENQDACAIVQLDLRDDASRSAVATNPGGLYLVADGMGGEERGELASRIATRVVVAEIWRALALPLLHSPIEAAAAAQSDTPIELPSLGETLTQAGKTANARIRALAGRLGRTTGTTLTALLALGGRAALLHVGDSRAYLLRGGTLQQLTQDHTLHARMKAAEHPLLDDPQFAMPRNLLYRSLGQSDEVEFDVRDVSLTAGDRLLLCSDGLWDDVDDARITAVLGGAAEPRAAARALVSAADAAGGRDNSTALVLFVESAG
ncbi:MAG TPA: protein phosphatase 2C domain-containing protein [Ktedonobacterales bacterium]|jgi:protein phosphatase